MYLVDKAYNKLCSSIYELYTMNVQQDSDYNHFFNDYNKRVCAEVNSVLWTMI